MKHILSGCAAWALVVWCVCAPAAATGLTVGPAAFVEEGVIECSISWRDAWRNDRNHDGAWVFVKVRRAGAPRWSHARIAAGGAAQVGGSDGPGAAFEIPGDRVGVFVLPGAEHRGDVGWTIRLQLDAEDLASLRGEGAMETMAFGVEVVEIPAGPFEAGDAGEQGVAHAAFFRQGDDGEPVGPYQVTSESEIAVNTGPGTLDYRTDGGPAIYRGDRLGPIPAAFPKGTARFYCMKYELTQGQYAAFLNALSSDATGFRAIHAGREYAAHRGTIDLVGDEYVSARPDRPANFITWEDSIAWADWAGLRPMTELEFEKACRGDAPAQANDYPWGTTSKDRLLRVVALDDDLVTGGEADASRLSDDTREVFGASRFWVMDLAGSVWERVVSVGHPVGRAFDGGHGDGNIDGYGFANVRGWPRGDVAPGGYGYRGGGWYGPDHDYSRGGFNPHSPAGWRPFAAWGQAPRYRAYGFRAVRSGSS